MTTEQIIWICAKLIQRQLGWLEFGVLLVAIACLIVLWLMWGDVKEIKRGGK